MTLGVGPRAETKGEPAEFQKRNWTARAEAWRKWHFKWALQSRWVTDLIVQSAGIGPGMRVLDLASGSGEPALEIASVVGTKGQVFALDIVPEMLQVTIENAAAMGLANVHSQAADAAFLPFPENSFDAVTCRFGFMFFTNPGGVMEEIRRVLRGGGRASIVTWGPMEENPRFVSTFGVVMNRLPEFSTEKPEVFKFDRPESLSAILADAGFYDISVSFRTVPFIWRGPTIEAWESLKELSAPFRRLLDRISDQDRESVTREILAAIGRYYDGESVNFSAKVVLATCRN